MRLGLCTAVILLLLVCVFGGVLWAAHPWAIDTVDADNGAGHSCLVLDALDHPHIAHHAWGGTRLKYESFNGSTWVTETLEEGALLGFETSLALDSSGHPHIAYSNYVEVGGEYGYELRYVRSDGSAWSPSDPGDRTLDRSTNQLAYHNSIALDSTDHPHIAYSDTTADDLKYAVWTGAAWNVQTVDTADQVGMECSLALDSDGHSHIAYRDSTNQQLKYAEWTGTAWSFAKTIPINASRPSLRLNASGYPRVAYTDSAGDLGYIAWNGTSWDPPDTVDGSDPDAHPCLALGPSDLPCIAYADRSSGYVKYAEWNATTETWDTEVADSVGRVGATSGIWLALTATGEPQITFSDERFFPVTYYDLLVASATGPLAVRWPR